VTPTAITDLIATERDRQRAKWGGEHSWGRGDCSSEAVAVRANDPDVAHLLRLAVLHEEAGEVARAVMERSDADLRDELIQVAAVCHAWLEALSR
jgi:hypothetical protein